MKRVVFLLALAFLLVPAMVAANEAVELPEVELSYENVTWEQGRKVFEEVCINCHSMHLHKRPGKVPTPYLAGNAKTVEEEKKNQENMKAGFGKVPPDLSLMVKARAGGAKYIYGFLTGFEEDKEKQCSSGNYNPVFAGGGGAGSPCAAMPPQNITEEQAKDVASFLWYASEPTLLVREEVGWMVVPFFAFLTVVLYLVKKMAWKDVMYKKKAVIAARKGPQPPGAA